MGIRTTGQLATRGLVALALVAAACVGAAAPAAAASQSVTITSNGFVPRDVTIQPGESVSFTNSDSTPHQVEFKNMAGVTCTSSPLVVAANGGTGSCTFATAGAYSYTDPNTRGNTFRGSVTVEAPAAVKGGLTLTASKALVVYGAKVTLAGKASPAKAGVSVELWARPYPEPAFAKVATVATAADGSYGFALPPRIRTEYRTQFTDGGTQGQSATVAVKVRPKVTLSVKSVSGSKAKMRTGVVSAASYAGKSLLLQRRNSQGGWTTVKKLTLGQFSTKVFTVRVPAGTSKWRTYLQASVAGGGYEASFSPTKRVRR